MVTNSQNKTLYYKLLILKNYRTKLQLFLSLILFLLISLLGNAQCGQEQTITICNMENIDYDNDGNPDGIINLYDEIGITPELGDFWESTGIEEGEEGIQSSGILRLWQLRSASEDYYFALRNPSCPSEYKVQINVKLGPYAGIAATTGFYPVCDFNDDCIAGIEIDINLFDTLESREGFALPHLNGEWIYTGSLPSEDFILDGANFGTTINNNGGFPVDSEDFTFRYVVSNIDTCTTEFVDVQITMVRPVKAGFGSSYRICEGDIESWDRDIDLYNNAYLNQEDRGGSWEDDNNSGQITSATDAVINLYQAYETFKASPEFVPGFACKEFNYTYKINSRSPICPDDEETVSFIIYEELRPFGPANTVEEICPNSSASQINLFDLLEFEPGYVYTDGSIADDFAYWVFLGSTASNNDLNLESNLNNLPEDEQHLGPITIAGARPGTYTFSYDVIPRQNCGVSISYSGSICDPLIGGSNPCPSISAIVTIEILPYDYAGEDTENIDICRNTTDQFSLRSLLNSDGRTIAEGIWTDNNNGGVVVSDTFVVPTAITAPISYSFTHTTSNDSGCIDDALLEFTIYKEADAGENVIVEVCSNNLRVVLFDQLQGDPDTTGTWFGPFGYISTDHLGIFDPDDDSLPILGPGTYVYNVLGNQACSQTSQSTVEVVFIDPVEVGEDINLSYCKTDGRVNLFQVLDRDTPRTGFFEDTDNTGALTAEGVVEFETLTSSIYNFRYIIANEAPCNESSITIALQIIDLPEPVVGDQEFCILDAARLDDIEVDVLNYNWYQTQGSDFPIIDNPLLFDDQVYYIAAVDADNCESERVLVNINILNTGERLTNGDLCTLDFQDGVSPDGNSQNDTFALTIDGEFNIPDAFPDFELQIFNRYGNLVFQGNNTTEEFRGVSNVSLSNGGDLPSGTYFYIFNPNFENNLPIQGSFYLTK